MFQFLVGWPRGREREKEKGRGKYLRKKVEKEEEKREKEEKRKKREEKREKRRKTFPAKKAWEIFSISPTEKLAKS